MIGLALFAAIVVGETPPTPSSSPPPPPLSSPAPTPAPPAPSPPVAPTPPSTAPEPPTAPSDQVGEAQIRAGFKAAEAARGPLDGRWRLARADGEALFDFQFSDSGGAPDERAASPDTPQIEGAWLDLRRPGALYALGVFASVKRDPDGLSLLFYEGAPPQAQSVTLRSMFGDVWTGELAAGGLRTKVTMTRD